MKKKKIPLRKITVIAQFAALTAICSWLQIPAIPIPFTMQTFAVFLSVYVLGMEKGFLSVLVYILLGVTGLPVFSKFQGGIGVIVGPTGGYIVGFLFTAITTGALLRLCREKPVPVCLSMLAGLLVCYVFGTVWLIIFSRIATGDMTFISALKTAVLPFIVP
ncbi:MAG: biotin transporter BioY, partial [Clostridia bacterium]|nr:biotin transporter BioY [Clostridia bacterium]